MAKRRKTTKAGKGSAAKKIAAAGKSRPKSALADAIAAIPRGAIGDYGDWQAGVNADQTVGIECGVADGEHDASPYVATVRGGRLLALRSA